MVGYGMKKSQANFLSFLTLFLNYKKKLLDGILVYGNDSNILLYVPFANNRFRENAKSKASFLW